MWMGVLLNRALVCSLLVLSLSGCFYYEAPINTTGDVYIYMQINDSDTPITEVKIPWK